MFIRHYKKRAYFVRSLGWIVWDGKRFETSDLKAKELAQQLSELILEDAKNMLFDARNELTESEVLEDDDSNSSAKTMVKSAKTYLTHALKTRSSSSINNMLEMAKPKMCIELEEVDADPFILNTPDGVISLKTGELLPHSIEHICTKITSHSASERGFELWNSFINQITGGDKEIENFLQQVAGMAAIGRVYQEALIIAHGTGSNGKSTLFNSWQSVLGLYGGGIDAEALTTNKQNKSHDLAELKGKRLVLAAELEEGRRLSTAMVKQLASTDRITAEKKYRDPESFKPSHSIVLFTNHIPKVGSTDTGTWRRLILVPFNVRITGKNDIKNYSEKLINESGEAILKWIVDGAIEFYKNDFSLVMPPIIREATQNYQNLNDWFLDFIEECCNIKIESREKSSDLYFTYRRWCERTGEYIRHNKDFNSEMEQRGFEFRKTKTGAFWSGIEIKDEYNY